MDSRPKDPGDRGVPDPGVHEADPLTDILVVLQVLQVTSCVHRVHLSKISRTKNVSASSRHHVNT